MALIEAVRGRFDIPQRWYRVKAQLLGMDRPPTLTAAPRCCLGVTFSYGESRNLVLDTYESFSPQAGGIVRRRTHSSASG